MYPRHYSTRTHMPSPQPHPSSMAHPPVQSHSLKHHSSNPCQHPMRPTPPSVSTSQKQFSTALPSKNLIPHHAPAEPLQPPRPPQPLPQTARKRYQLLPHAARKSANHEPIPKPSLASTATYAHADRRRAPPIRCVATCSTAAAAKRFARNASTNSDGTCRRRVQRHRARGNVRTVLGNVLNERNA